MVWSRFSSLVLDSTLRILSIWALDRTSAGGGGTCPDKDISYCEEVSVNGGTNGEDRPTAWRDGGHGSNVDLASYHMNNFIFTPGNGGVGDTCGKFTK